VLTEVFSEIYQSTDDLQMAQRLVEKIVLRLKKKHASIRKRTRRSNAS
jgi:hypothetical protein